MYCPRCGALNPDGSAFCGACGANLGLLLTWQPGTPAAGPAGEPSTPILAAILCFLFGIGYVYLNLKSVMGIPAIVFVFAMIAVYFVAGVLTFGVMSFVLGAVLAADGYQKARGGTGFVPAR